LVEPIDVNEHGIEAPDDIVLIFAWEQYCEQ